MGNYKTKKLEDFKINTKIKLLVLWITLMILYIYADIFSFYRPGYINEVIAGFMGPLKVSQMTLISSSILMAIPTLMIVVCLFSKEKMVRWLNIIAGSLYTVVGVGNLLGETWVYYLLYGTIEIIITIFIVVTALRWSKRKEVQ